MTLWKIVHYKKPEYFLSKITILDDYTLNTEIPRLQITKTNFRHRAIEQWNSLPQHLRETTGICHFKKNLKNWIKQQRPQQRPPDT